MDLFAVQKFGKKMMCYRQQGTVIHSLLVEERQRDWPHSAVPSSQPQKMPLEFKHSGEIALLQDQKYHSLLNLFMNKIRKAGSIPV